MTQTIRNLSNKSLEHLFLLTVLLFPISIALRNILLGLLLIFYLFNKIINKDFSLPKTFLNKYILIFFIFSVLSFINSNNIHASLDTLLSPIFRYIAFFIIAYEVIDNEKSDKYINFLISGGFLILIIGYYIDYCTSDSFFYRNNEFGATAAFLIIFFISVFLNYDKVSFKIISFLGFLFSINAIVISYSRGATLGLLAAIIMMLSIYIWFKFSLRNRKIAVILTISLVILFLILTPFVLPDRLINRFKNTNLNYNSNPRILMWRTTIEMIKEYPVLGAGLGTFNSYFLYNVDNVFEGAKLSAAGRKHEKPHNLYLFIAAEQGIPSLAIYLVMLYLSFKLALLNYSKNSSRKNKFISLTLLGFLTQIFIHSFVDTSVLYGQIGLYVIIFLILNDKSNEEWRCK